MTTAHRPTYTGARAYSDRHDLRTTNFSSKDLPKHLTLKRRHDINKAKKEPEKPVVKQEKEEKKPKALVEQDEDDDLDSSSSSESEGDGEGEDFAAVMREFEKIKKERDQEAANQAQENEAALEAERAEAAVKGNPLLNQDATGRTKRSWYDDVVFRNQGRNEPDSKKRFINDMLRSDFHKRFMKKYFN